MTPQKTDLGHGRGWAAPAAAASIFRIDAQLGRPADINEAGRSREQADENYRKYLAYLAGGPWAPLALPADKSVHVPGMAADSDDWYDPTAAAVWRDNGWRQTARYPNNPKKDEPWHGEYFPDLDNHRNNPAAAGGTTTKDDDMPLNEADKAWMRLMVQQEIKTTQEAVSRVLPNGKIQSRIDDLAVWLGKIMDMIAALTKR